MLSYLLAVAAACANAVANVLQRKTNRDEPPELSMSPRLISQLAQRPAWLGGFVAVVASFLLMAAALGQGHLAAIQPIVVLELPLTLVGAARLLDARLGWSEWAAALAMTTGLAGLIFFLSPRGGSSHVSGMHWLVGTVITVLATVAVLAIGLLGTEPRVQARRPAALGIATGMVFGLTAAFIKGMTAEFSHGVVGILTSWQIYAIAVSGLAGVFLMQNALHSGRLLVGQPGITLANPAVAIAWGLTVFRERTRGGEDLVLAALSGILIAVATLVLSRSPLLGDEGGSNGTGEQREEALNERGPKQARAS